MKAFGIFAFCLLAGSLSTFAQSSAVSDSIIGIEELMEVNYGITPVKQKVYPLVFVDGEVWEIPDKDREAFDWQNDVDDKRKVAQLLHIRPRRIMRITSLAGDEAIQAWGSRGKNGVLEVYTGKKPQAVDRVPRTGTGRN